MTSYRLQSAASPNHGAQTVPRPCRLVVLHWWGNPSGQDPYGVISWLRNSASQVSAHYVIWPGNAVRLLDLRARSWANGNDWANNNSITLECDPNNVVDTMTTVVDLLADLVRSGDLAPDFELHGHRDYYSTACPGAYYQWLPSIRQRVTDALDSPEEDDMPKLTDKVTLANGETTYAEAIRLNDANQQRLIGDLVAIKRTVEDLLAREAQWAPANFAAILQRLDQIDAKLDGGAR